MGKSKRKQKHKKSLPNKPRKQWSKHRLKQKILNNNGFWIQTCKINKVPKKFPSDMVLKARISLVHLVDDHMHAGTTVHNFIQTLSSTTENQNGNVASVEEHRFTVPMQPKEEEVSAEEEEEEVSAEEDEEDEEEEEEEDDTVDKKELVKEEEEAEEEEEAVDKEELETTDKVVQDANKNHNKTQVEDQQCFITEPFINIRKSKRLIKAMNYRIQLPNIQNLPNGDCGDGIVNPYPKEEVPDKFWAQRKRLFHKYDEGIVLDKESWYSVTPEVIATHIARRIGNMKHNAKFNTSLIVLDPFCGVGGNAIALARNENISLVVCCDIDENKLKYAAHNASIYGIPRRKMIFVHGNALTVLKSYTNGVLNDAEIRDKNTNVCDDCKGYQMGNLSLLPNELHIVFLSPPWGGVDYLKAGTSGFNLSKCIQVRNHDSNIVDGEELLNMAAKAALYKSVVYFLPKNIYGIDIGRCAFKEGYRKEIELEQNHLNGKLKTVTIYLSDVANGY
jgi:trimethylguanosine synthase